MSATQKWNRAFGLSLIAGTLILTNAVAVAAAATWAPGLFPTLPGSSGNDTTMLYNVALIGLICGALVTLGATMLRSKPAHRRAWGAMIVVCSIPSVVTGGGFIMGFIIGIIGGALALTRKSTS